MECKSSPNEYLISAANHVERIERLLIDGSIASLLYAALELRLGTEERQSYYAEHWEHIPASKKKSWKNSDLGKALDNAFNFEQIMILTYELYDGHPAIESHYVPVSKRLRDICDQLGNYLHAKGWHREYKKGSPDAKIWRQTLHALVLEGYVHLKLAISGNLSGPGLLRKGTNTLKVNATFDTSDATRIKEANAKEKGILLSVEHVDFSSVLAPLYETAKTDFPYKADLERTPEELS